MAFFRSLSSYYIEETEKWLWASPGRCVTRAKVAVLFGNAYRKAVTVATTISVFWSMGIWPVNRDVYQDLHLFSSGANTHRTDIVQPVQTALHDEAGTSPASSQEQEVEIHPY